MELRKSCNAHEKCVAVSRKKMRRRGSPIAQTQRETSREVKKVSHPVKIFYLPRSPAYSHSILHSFLRLDLGEREKEATGSLRGKRLLSMRGREEKRTLFLSRRPGKCLLESSSFFHSGRTGEENQGSWERRHVSQRQSWNAS